jgi:hypothetical protein
MFVDVGKRSISNRLPATGSVIRAQSDAMLRLDELTCYSCAMKILVLLVSYGVGITLSVFLAWGLAASWSRSGIASAEVAAWAQALGSIGAIAGAIYLMHAQHKLQQALERNRELNQRVNLLLVAIMFAQETRAAFEILNLLDVQGSNSSIRVSDAEFISVHLKGTLAYAESSPFLLLPSPEAIKVAMVRQTCRGLIGALSGAQAELQSRNSTGTQFYPQPRVRADAVFVSVRSGIDVLPGLISGLRSSYTEITGIEAPN